MTQAHSHGHPHTSQTGASDRDDRLRLTWTNLTALGVVGGMIPSTSAIIVLLAAVSLHRVGLGLLMIVAFSLGMAGVLAGVGLALVYSRGLIDRIGSGGRLVGGFTRALPLVTALVIVLSGLVVTVRSALQVGSL